MIAAGTGIAPFRGFVQEREYLQRHGSKLGEAALFFGCRTRAAFLYEAETQKAQAEGVLSEVHVAFSRQEGCDNQYVQHVIRQQGDLVRRYVHHKAIIYVCGATNMAAAVREALDDVVPY